MEEDFNEEMLDEDDFVDADAQVKIEALINILVRKGIFTEEEFDEEYDKVVEEAEKEEE